ncbi:MAG: hypothetical protein IKF49_03725 [Clostridia bacterium]|nr:hypothetical protein [Clostridia bacterium]
MDKKKKTIPGSAIGLYICGGIMAVLFIMSIIGIAIGGQNEMRIFFITSAAITAVMVITCLLLAQWMTQREASKHKRFASYAFEGELAPQKKVPQNQLSTGKRTHK